MRSATSVCLTLMYCAQDGRTPLYSAVDRGHAEVVKLLIEAGANINQVNKVIMYFLP